MRTAYGLRSCLGKPEMFDLACCDEFLYRARNVLDDDRRVNSMLVEQVGGAGLQAFQHRLDHFSNVLRTAIQAAAPLPGFRINVEAEFCRDHDLITKWCDRFPHKFFVCERAICLCRIEEGHALRSKAVRIILTPS
jgi:hypothetical protein